MNTQKTFNQMQIELDATLLAARVRIAYQKGYGRNTLAKMFNLTPRRVKTYIRGVYCPAKTLTLPIQLCTQRSKFWGIPVFRHSCSKDRLRRKSAFHRDSYIPSKTHRNSWARRSRELQT